MTTDVKPRSLEPEGPLVQGVRPADRNFIPVPTLVDANTLVPEAPEDGVIYGRRGSDQTWRALTVTVNETLEGDGDGLTAPLGVAWATADAPGILSVPDGSALTLVQVATIPPSRSVNMTLGLDTATGQDVLDGTSDTLPITPAALAEALTGGWDVLDDRFVNVDGDVMTGNLTVDADLFITGAAAAGFIPTADEHLTNKLYVDSHITGTLTLIGTFNASTGQVTFSYASGIPNGPLPPADAGNLNQYVIVAVAGQPPIGPPETQIIQQVGDWWVSDGTVWLYLPIGGDTIAARNVALIPPAFGEDNVQDAMEAAEAAVDGKVDKTGDTMTGDLVIRDPTGSFLIVDGTPGANATVRLNAAALAALELNTQGDALITMRLPSGEEFDLVTSGAANSLSLTAGTGPGSVIFEVDHTQKIARFPLPPRTPVDATVDDDLVRKGYVDAVVGRVPIGPTPPPGALPGALWWRDDPDGDFYILYDDGSSIQWVSTTKPGLGGPGGGVTPPPFDDSHLLPLTGGTVTGELLVTGPTTAPQSVVTRDWVETITSGALYQGGWRVSTNVPPLPAAPRHGDRYLCLTANADVPETPPGNIPGLAGRPINNGAYIIWDEPAGLWQLIQFSLGGGLTTDTADLRYLRLAGGTTTGKIITPATVDADAATTLATKGYVDGKVASGSDVTAWQTHAANGLWNTRSNVNLRLINGGANIQIRALLDPNTRPLTTSGSVAFTLPGTHRPRWNGSTTCAGPRQTQTPDNLDTIGNVSWFAASGEVRANAIFNTNNWVPPPQWLLLDIVIPRT